MRAGRLLASVASLSFGAAIAQADAGDGAGLFELHCASCHNSGGTGTPGLAPPLDRAAFWQALGEDAPRYLGGIVTKGFNMPISVRGERYVGMFMPPVAGVTDKELADIATWLLAELGETGYSMTPADIATIRDSGLTNQDLRALRPQTE